jgi:AcrR family transcriptional regulator
MPKVTGAYLDARRQQVLDAAFVCFARKGFHETTMKDIAREAGVSYGVVYHYFPSKEDLFAAGYLLAAEDRAERFAQAEREGHAVQVLKEALRLGVGRWADPKAEMEMKRRVLLVAEGLRNPRIGSALFDGFGDYRARYRAIVQRGQERGEIDGDVDAEAVALVLVSLQMGLETLKAADPTVDVPRYLNAVEALLSGLLRQGGN